MVTLYPKKLYGDGQHIRQFQLYLNQNDFVQVILISMNQYLGKKLESDVSALRIIVNMS